MSRRYLWAQIRAELLDLAWRLTKGSRRSERVIARHERRNARIIRRAARR
jgi:hypothetical protein